MNRIDNIRRIVIYREGILFRVKIERINEEDELLEFLTQEKIEAFHQFIQVNKLDKKLGKNFIYKVVE